MRALVTGGSGFLGGYVVAQLRAAGAEVTSVSRQQRVSRHGEICKSLARPEDSGEVARLVAESRPELILHLAGLSSAPSLSDFYVGNTVFAANLLDAAAAQQCAPIVVLAGSAAEYGPVPDADLPVRESYACKPNSPYGISKYAQSLHGLAAASRGLRVVIARIFNPIGAGMSANLALGSFARQLAQLGKSGGSLRTGNLDVERDFIEVSEAARLIIALGSTPDAAGEVVNVCTGLAWNLFEVTSRLIELSGLSVTLEFESARQGNSTSSRFLGDPGKLKALGLAPAIPDMDTVLTAILAGAQRQCREQIAQ